MESEKIYGLIYCLSKKYPSTIIFEHYVYYMHTSDGIKNTLINFRKPGNYTNNFILILD